MSAYDSDLAYIHDQGYGGFARDSAPGLLEHLAEAGIAEGLVVDLGCGSGIWAEILHARGYQVMGVDVSSAMIELARRRNPDVPFHVVSLFDFCFPSCHVVTALGEVFNYMFVPGNSLHALRALWQDIYRALRPGGLLIFDLCDLSRSRGRTQAFSEGPDWTCLVEYRRDDALRQLNRRIVTFRRDGEHYRRAEETHRQQLYSEEEVIGTLSAVGFSVRTVRQYGDYRLADGVVGYVARKPGGAESSAELAR